MYSTRRLLSWMLLIGMLALLLVACERPFPRSNETDTNGTTVNNGAVVNETIAEQPPESGAENRAGSADSTEEAPAEGNAAETPEAAPTDKPADTPRVEETSTPTVEPTATPETKPTPTATPTAEAAAAETAAATETAEAAESGDSTKTDESTASAESGTDKPAAETGATGGETTAESGDAGDTPATHTVAAGENLYRIGLNYGISWVTLADINDLTNANDIKTGQVIRLSAEEPGTPEPEPTPSPLTETTYTVQVGDNLYRIGLRYGISWVQIAEANGIVNPNEIRPGVELKIPISTPGPAPQFTHVVKQGETLFLISLQYGVAWPTVAAANDLASPYVIYPGQTLVIPGG